MRDKNSAILFIFSGLPGTGKSTLAKILSRHRGACYLRIDTIEQQLRSLYSVEIGGEGYQIAYQLAAENLKLGIDVIADSCNPVEESRINWQDTAKKCGAEFINIQVICSSVTEHRQRIEVRRSDIPGLKLPAWPDVENREYHRWSTERIIIDTAGRTAEQSFNMLLKKLNENGVGGSGHTIR